MVWVYLAAPLPPPTVDLHPFGYIPGIKLLSHQLQQLVASEPYIPGPQKDLSWFIGDCHSSQIFSITTILQLFLILIFPGFLFFVFLNIITSNSLVIESKLLMLMKRTLNY